MTSRLGATTCCVHSCIPLLRMFLDVFCINVYRHGSSGVPNDAELWMTPQFLEEHHLPVFEAFLDPTRGGSEGGLCFPRICLVLC